MAKKAKKKLSISRSKARRKFFSNAKDVKRLVEIHGHLVGTGPGRKHGVEVLNKSGVVLITAFWEAYCEDVAAEALEHLLNKVTDASKLPKELKKRLADDVKKDKNDLAVWSLADHGWKAMAKSRLAALTKDRNWKLNTPKSQDIEDLFLNSLGIPDVTKEWRWQKMKRDDARTKLDDYVSLRGAIAHRGSSGTSCLKTDVMDYLQHVYSLVQVTDKAVKSFIKAHAGSKPW